MKKIFLCLITAIFPLLFGCAKEIEPQGQWVRTTHTKPTGNCSAIADAVGSQGNWITGSFTSNKDLIEGATNDLRNQAGRMGGNMVWIRKQETHTVKTENQQDNPVNVTVQGTVYQCK